MLTAATVKRWTRAEYHRLAEQGWFDGQRVQLIEGEIVEMSPQNWPHHAAILKVQRVLTRIFGDEYFVTVQAPLALGDMAEPEPDVAVIRGRIEDFQDHPTTAALVVEVADTTLAHDLKEKAGLYAKHGIADYWVVNLIDRRLHVHRRPRPDAKATMGFGYDVDVLKAAQSVAPLAMPGKTVSVADLLP